MKSNSLVFLGSNKKSASTTEFLIRSSCGLPASADNTGKRIHDLMASKGYELNAGAKEALKYYSEKNSESFYALLSSLFVVDPMLIEWGEFLMSPEHIDWHLVGIDTHDSDGDDLHLLPSKEDALAFIFENFSYLLCDREISFEIDEDGRLTFFSNGKELIVIVSAQRLDSALVDSSAINKSYQAIRSLSTESEEEEFSRLSRVPGLKNLAGSMIYSVRRTEKHQQLSLGTPELKKRLKRILEGMYGAPVALNLAGEVLARIVRFESWQHLRAAEKKAFDIAFSPYLCSLSSYRSNESGERLVWFAYSLEECLAHVGEMVEPSAEISVAIFGDPISFDFSYDEGCSHCCFRVVGQRRALPGDSSAKKMARRFLSSDPQARTSTLSKIILQLEAGQPEKIDTAHPRFDFPFSAEE